MQERSYCFSFTSFLFIVFRKSGQHSILFCGVFAFKTFSFGLRRTQIYGCKRYAVAFFAVSAERSSATADAFMYRRNEGAALMFSLPCSEQRRTKSSAPSPTATTGSASGKDAKAVRQRTTACPRRHVFRFENGVVKLFLRASITAMTVPEKSDIFSAAAAREETAKQGISLSNANPFGAGNVILTPVKEPGPAVTAIRSMSSIVFSDCSRTF